jgi:hypothetical protein
MLKSLTILSLASTLLFTAGCSDEDEVPNTVFTAEVFNTPVGAGGPGPAMAGDTYSFTFAAVPGQKLTFATMYITTNDLVFTPIEAGIDLYKDGEALSGDITNRIILVDAGTEENQVIGSGADQANQQSAPNTGAADPNNLVRLYDGNDEAETENLIRVTVTNEAANFTVNIQVLPTSTTPIAPGVFAVYTGSNPVFSLGTEDRGQGLEALAEDGAPEDLEAYLKSAR